MKNIVQNQIQSLIGYNNYFIHFGHSVHRIDKKNEYENIDWA